MPSEGFTSFGIRGSLADNRHGVEPTASVIAGVKSKIGIDNLRGEKIISFSRFDADLQRLGSLANRKHRRFLVERCCGAFSLLSGFDVNVL